MSYLVRLLSSTYSVTEGDMNVEVCAELTSQPAEELTVTLMTSDGKRVSTFYRF